MGRPTPKSQRSSINKAISIQTREDLNNRKNNRERYHDADLDFTRGRNLTDQSIYDDYEDTDYDYDYDYDYEDYNEEEQYTKRDMLMQKYSGSHKSSADYNMLASGNKVDNDNTASLLRRGM